MRNRFTITITDFRGSHHYSMRQVAKTYALGIVLSLLLTVLSGALVIYFLNQKLSSLNTEITDLQNRRGMAQREYASLQQERGKLLQAVEEKSSELARVSDELGTIEVMIGLEPAPEADIKTRLDTANQTAMEKMLMLQLVPSGYPLEYKGVTSSFGYRIHPITIQRAFHAGVDLRAKTGTPVYATADGVIEWASLHKSSGLGNLVIIHHSFGFETFYGHLDRFAVKSGDFVKKGDLIAYSGNSGRSNGPHLHYEIRHIQRRLDPGPFLEWGLNNYDELFEKEGRVQWDSLAKAVSLRNNIPGRRLSLVEQSSAEN